MDEVPNIFVSYAIEDASKAAKLCSALDVLGFNSFLAHKDIQMGTIWRESILKALESSNVFIPILTDDALESAMVHQESGIAHHLKKQRKDKYEIIPLIQKGKIPPGFLEEYQGALLRTVFLIGGLKFDDDFVRKIALIIVKGLKCGHVIREQIFANMKSGSIPKLEHSLEFMNLLGPITYENLQILIDFDTSTNRISRSDRFMNFLQNWQKNHVAELEEYPDWQISWIELMNRYESRKKREAEDAKEMQDATRKAIRSSLESLPPYTRPAEENDDGPNLTR